LLVGDADILADVLQLHEQQRQTVDETDDIRPAAVQIAAHPQLPHTKEMIVIQMIEIEDPQVLALGVAESDLHPALDQCVLFAVGGGQRLCGGDCDDLADGVFIGRGRQAGIQLFELRP